MKNLSVNLWPLLVALFVWSNGQRLPSKNIEQLMTEQGEKLLSKGDLNGLSIGVYKSGKIYKAHLGHLNKAYHSTPNDTTVYEIASLTKTFTGTLLAQAVIDKKVQLQDDVREYLPSTFPNLEFNGEPITFTHLVTHNSQLPFLFPHTPDLFEEIDPIKISLRINELTEGRTKEQFFKALATFQLATLPGSGFTYSNAGANLLGYCLEHIYQKDFEDLLQAFIFDPLEMNNTAINPSEEVAKGYTSRGFEMPFIATKEMNADGGIKSNLSDMMQYLAFHIKEQNPVVKAAHVELLNGKFDGFENALFWQMFKNENGERKIFQNGGAPGTSSWMTFIPEKEIGVFIITNTSGADVHQRLSDVVDKILVEVESLSE